MQRIKILKLVNNYKKYYYIPKNISISMNMILKHWKLERSLTEELLNSTAENRWKTFERSYTSLFSALPWLNEYANTDPAYSKIQKYHYQIWVDLIGKSQKKIIEIGSGKGNFINYLSKLGHKCTATEITYERGNKFKKDSDIVWIESDGIHLEKFTQRNSFDLAISVQVIEHFHPDDIYSHFKGIYAILKKNGKYIFTTPHNFSGPYDISRLFNYYKPQGMHLKEYTYQELITKLHQIGFNKISVVLRIPPLITKILKVYFKPRIYNFYLHYLLILEKIISHFPIFKTKLNIKFNAIIFLMGFLFFPNIFIVAER